MGILIDSSSLIAAERGELDLEAALGHALDEDVAIAAITASELLHGVHRLKGGVKQAKAERFVERLLDRIPVMAFDLDAARVHARLGAELAAKGTAVGAHDLIIASTAVAIDFAVATRDVRSFPRIAGLTLHRW
ncbi:MAG TPA: PIN domain-containing protein [Vicinamibacterales bacterium]|nr:PIN domain-containing protein [Vicinamibacterales bacterium]